MMQIGTEARGEPTTRVLPPEAVDRRRVRNEYYYLVKAATRRRRWANVLVVVSLGAVLALTAWLGHLLTT